MGNRGFILVEILISALILAGSVAAGMYLFRTGFQYLEKIQENNLLSSKVPQALSYLTKGADLEKKEEEISLGENVILSWKAKLIEKVKPQIALEEAGVYNPYELYLYQVDFTLKHKNTVRSYQILVTKYKMLITPEGGI